MFCCVLHVLNWSSQWTDAVCAPLGLIAGLAQDVLLIHVCHDVTTQQSVLLACSRA